jgi:long-chain acyl-CoA synthetase
MAATLGELLPEAACRFGDRAAVIVENQVFTFNQLDELSNRIANGLVASGVKAGDRVTLYGHNCWECVAL